MPFWATNSTFYIPNSKLFYTFANNMFNVAQYFPITDPTLIFFVVLLIILFAPIIMGKLRIPHIIGMVLAGVAIGQYGFNILSRDQSFELFGKVGIYYIMFLASRLFSLTLWAQRCWAMYRQQPSSWDV